MRRNLLIATSFMSFVLSHQAYAGQKVEFNATVRADIACELGYRIVHVNKKKGSTDEYCAIGPKAATRYLEQNVDKEVNIKGHDGTQTVGAAQVQVLWIDKVAGNKVRDYDPCHVSTTYAILAGLGGQMPQLPPGCGGDTASSSPDTASAAADQESAAQSSYPSEQSSPQLTATPQPTSATTSSDHFVNGLPQCTRTQFEYQGATLWIVNNCNVNVTVGLTSDSGNTWGQVDVGPNSRTAATIFGIGYSPKKDGTVYLFTCPKGSQPVLPNGNPSMPRNYKGQYTCHEQ